MKINASKLSTSKSYRLNKPNINEAIGNKTLVIKPVNFMSATFLKGPIPLDWLKTAANLPGKSLHVAIALCFLSGIKKNKTVKLTQVLLNGFGVDRHSKYRALNALAGAELISFCSKNGKNPLITLLDKPVIEPS